MHQTQNRKKSGKIFRELLKGNFINKSSLIFKKTNLRNIRFNENFKRLDDYQFAVDLSEKYDYYFIEENLTKIRQHSRNITSSDYIILYLDYIKIYQYFLYTLYQKLERHRQNPQINKFSNFVLIISTLFSFIDFVNRSIQGVYANNDEVTSENFRAV